MRVKKRFNAEAIAQTILLGGLLMRKSRPDQSFARHSVTETIAEKKS